MIENDHSINLKKLLIPVWLLVIISLGILIALVLQFVSPGGRPLLPVIDTQSDQFYDWPIEKQVAASSVIARGEWRVENNVYKCIIAEILKQEPGVSFAYKIGDGFPQGNQPVKPNTNYGDGELLFFTGSHPTLRLISAIANGRLSGLGDVPLERVTDLAKANSSRR